MNEIAIDSIFIENKNEITNATDYSFGGKIKLPKNGKGEFEFGRWTNDSGEIVKGGNSVNPFIQLKNQKERFINVCKNHIIPNLNNSDKLNAYHTVRMVCFQKSIELDGSIPSREELNFFIIDQDNYLEKIKDIIDITSKDVKLSKNSFDLFKEVFRADKFNIKETYSENITFDATSREICTVKRENTSSPLQSLVLLNDVQFFEASRVFAERIFAESKDTLEAQITYGFRLATSRFPEPQEIQLMKELYENQRAYYKKNKRQAYKVVNVGNTKYKQQSKVDKVAAMTIVANTLLNMNESYYKY
jgi:hypothetical protein